MNDSPSQTATLLSRLHRGDRAALEALLERDLPWIERLVRRRLGPRLRSREETVDVVQDAMVEILADGPKFVIEGQTRFRALVARLVENQIRDRLRYHQQARRSPDHEASVTASDSVVAVGAVQDVAPPPDADAARREEEERLRLALDLLDPDDRRVLELREFDGLQFDDVGERLGVSANTARMRFQRSLPRLAKVLEGLRNGQLDAALSAAEEDS